MATTPSYLFQLGPLPGALEPLGLPVLAGEPVDAIFAGARPAGEAGPFRLLSRGDWLVGFAALPLGAGVERAARLGYRALLGAAASRDRHLCRVWNYVPRINEHAPAAEGGLELYQAFCRGRSLAFEEAHGDGFAARLPAASAVGTEGGALAIAFAASARAPRHVENPDQVPAYAYPARYGPRPPSFARATVLGGPGGDDVFISGTAAVRGHATVAPGSTAAQLESTFQNLDRIAAACGIGATAAEARGAARFVRAYLRHAADLPRTEAALRARLLRPGDQVSYLRADLCRAELNVEIELTVLGAGPGARHPC